MKTKIKHLAERHSRYIWFETWNKAFCVGYSNIYPEPLLDHWYESELRVWTASNSQFEGYDLPKNWILQ